MKTGVLLINLGTPDHPTPESVGRYLREFLMDPYVVDIPSLARWVLVNWLIVPKRAHTSAEAYQKVWTARGSPLRFFHEELTQKVQTQLGDAYLVQGGMRYGEPSIERALSYLKDQKVEKVLIAPLYPQYSTAATESSLEHTRKVLHDLKWQPAFILLPDFYESLGFIKVFAALTQQSMQESSATHAVFSFHGLPERQIRKTDPSGSHCLASSNCCEQIGPKNAKCYRAQCYATARAIAAELKLKPSDYSVAFQSRLGRTPWIQPFSDHLYEELPKRNIRKVVVACPSFVADCLETLEEVAIRGKEQFLQAGGTDLRLVPSLNADSRWVDTVVSWIKDDFATVQGCQTAPGPNHLGQSI